MVTWFKSSPLAHLPWVIRTLLRTAPVDGAINLTASLVQGLVPAAVLLMLKQAVDAVGAELEPALFLRILMGLAGLLVLKEVTGTLFPVTNNRLANLLGPAVQELVLSKASRLSLAQFDQSATHDLVERASQEHGARTASVWNRLLWTLQLSLRTLSATALIAVVLPGLAALAFAGALPVAWVNMRFGQRFFHLNRTQTETRRMTKYVTGLLCDRQAATELRAFQLLPFFLERWRRLFGRQADEQLQAHWTGAREGLLAELISAIIYALTLGLFVRTALSGSMGAGDLVALVSAFFLLLQSAPAALSIASQIWEQALPLADLRRFLALPEEERELTASLPFPRPLTGPIRFEEVSFRYPGQERSVLDRISLEIRPGEKLALVGANGAGKSTLIKLLLGLYQPTEGRITIGGVDLAHIAPASLRAGVSCIFQDFARLDMTLLENVAAGRPGATEAEIAEACRAAGCADLAESLPQGYQTLLGKSFTGGLELSGGQWQRVALARAFVRDGELLVLDEPTAALDARAELDLFGKFVALVRGRTALLISHRLGAARLADRVIVLADGRIAEVGTHDDLVAAGGRYASLFRLQAQWYEDERPAVTEVAV